MHFTSRDANFCAHSKFTPIGELGRGIVHQDSAVNPFKEFVTHSHIFAHHAFCMRRAKGLDMCNCRIHICNGLGGNNAVQIFLTPILIRSWGDPIQL